jgi:hypothetical protein
MEHFVSGKKWLFEGETALPSAYMAFAVTFVYTKPNTLDVQEGLHHPHDDIELCLEELAVVTYDEDATSEIRNPSDFLTDEQIKDLILDGSLGWKRYKEGQPLNIK